MRDLLIQIRRLYDQLFELISALKSPFLLFVRLYWGWQLIESGWGKLHNLPKVIDLFTSLGLPFPEPAAFFISCLEFFGGPVIVVCHPTYLLPGGNSAKSL